MKIQGRRPSEAHELIVNTQGAQKVMVKGKATTSQGQQRVDRIDISERGKEAASIIGTINSMPEVRGEKVQAIKDAVNSGTYKVDPFKVATKMLSEL